MNPGIVLLLAILLHPVGVNRIEAKEPKQKDSIELHTTSSNQGSIGKPGFVATYRHESGGAIPGSVVRTLRLALGPLEEKNGRQFQWLHLHAVKANGEPFSVWILTKGYRPAGYRQIVRVREDGKVEVIANGKNTLHDGPRIPDRPEGNPPQLTVELSTESGKAPLRIAARAFLAEGSSDVYYTLGASSKGIYKNVMVLWELYGPGEEDYRFLLSENREPRILDEGARTKVEIQFTIRQPGRYRLRAATVDLAGRTTVVWKSITVED